MRGWDETSNVTVPYPEWMRVAYDEEVLRWYFKLRLIDVLREAARREE